MKTTSIIALSSLFFVAGVSAGQWSAGPVGILQASPYAGGESGLMIFPGVAYQGEKFSLRGPFADYYVYGSAREDIAIAVTLALGPNQLEVDGDQALAGIEDRDSGLLGGVRLEYGIWDGTASLALQSDVTDESGGQRIVAGWQKPLFESDPRKWMFSAGVQVEWISDDYADYYFGVSEAEAAASRFNAYEASSVVQPSLTFAGYYNFDENWQFIYNLDWQFLASDIENSPIVDQSSVASGVIGLVYNF